MTLPLTTSDASALLGVYARVGPLFVAGEGSELIAEDGTRYLDFVAGIAVNALGYNSPVIRDAVLRALDAGLIHVSNLYRTEPGERLAAELTKSFGGLAFFGALVGGVHFLVFAPIIVIRDGSTARAALGRSARAARLPSSDSREDWNRARIVHSQALRFCGGFRLTRSCSAASSSG